MRRRSRQCNSQMIDLETYPQGPDFMHPGGCFLFTTYPQPEIPAGITPPGIRQNIDVAYLPEPYDNAMFYGMPQYRGFQYHPHHPNHPSLNLDLGVATPHNFYLSHAASPSGVALSHGSSDQVSYPGNYKAVETSVYEYGINGHLMDNSRGSYKGKISEGIPGNFHPVHSSASTSSSGTTSFGTRESDAIMIPLQHRGIDTPSTPEILSHRSARNRSGSTLSDPVLAHNQNHFIAESYPEQPFHPAVDATDSTWTQNTNFLLMHGNLVDGTSMEIGNVGQYQYHNPASNRSNANILLPPPATIQHHGFHPLLPVQGIRTHNINAQSQMLPASFPHPTTYSSQSINPPPNDVRVRHQGSTPPTGFRIYSQRNEVMPDTTLRRHNLPQIRVLPTDGVALMEFPDYYDMSSDDDHHRDLRLDIEDMSYEELLALGEWIGNVNTGVSKEKIKSQLKTRTYALPSVIDLEELPFADQEEAAGADKETSKSCIICQDDYVIGEKLGILNCGHEYHVDCLKQWLHVKNVCPICKSEALPT